MQVAASWREAIESTLARNPSLETWSGHFKHRLPELEEILLYWPRKRVNSALEIGCGNGLAATYFSPLVGKIIASDLAHIDSQAHSIGLEQARTFFAEMKLSNAEVLGCSAEKIPLPDQSFDLVYGIYCLEHIPDRPAALKETRRVLRSEGEALFTVPGAAWAFFFPFGFYTELIQRIWARLKAKLFPTVPDSDSPRTTNGESQSAKVTGAATFFRYYPHFPFPEPHGHHSSWPAELRYYRISQWERLVRDAGFCEVEVEPLCFLPKFAKIFMPMSLQARIEETLKSKPALKAYAQFYCIRAIAP